MQYFKTLLIFVLATALTLGVQAQTKVLQKEVKKAYKSMTAEQQEALLKYANLGLSGKEEGIAITDKKTLNKYFRLLPPKHQEQVVKYAESIQNMEGPESRVATAPNPPAAPKKPAVAQPARVNGQSNLNYPPKGGESTVQPTPPPTPPQPAWIVKAESMPATQVEWYETTYDFGKITEGDVVSHTFKFKNVGDNPLLLTRVKPSCGCTSPKWSQEPIAPGEEGIVEVSFNSSHKRGMQSKSVVITHNGDPINKVLVFRAEVQPKPTPANGNN